MNNQLNASSDLETAFAAVDGDTLHGVVGGAYGPVGGGGGGGGGGGDQGSHGLDIAKIGQAGLEGAKDGFLRSLVPAGIAAVGGLAAGPEGAVLAGAKKLAQGTLSGLGTGVGTEIIREAT